MIYLFLAILCSSSIAIIFKYSEGNNLNRYAVTSINYLTAFIVSLVMALKENLFDISEGIFNKFLNEFANVVIHNEGSFSAEASFVWAILVGVSAGIFFFSSFIYYQHSVRENGVGLSGAFSKLGILVPMAFSIILWKEIPGPIQWIGIILSLSSIVIVNTSFNSNLLKNIRKNLVLLFLLGGIAEFSNKIFQKYGLLEFKSIFLFFVFFSAFCISLYFTYKNNNKITKDDIITGFMVGIPNLFSSFFLILALNYLKTSVVFPLYSAGTIIVISIVGSLIFKEKLVRREKISIIMTILALILINMKN